MLCFVCSFTCLCKSFGDVCSSGNLLLLLLLLLLLPRLLWLLHLLLALTAVVGAAVAIFSSVPQFNLMPKQRANTGADGRSPPESGAGCERLGVLSTDERVENKGADC